MPPPVLSIVGRSGVGKTTLIERLIPEFKERGLLVATIKHHAHPGFEIDIPGKDTWRYSKAGSDQVIIAAPDKIAIIRRLDHELRLNEILEHISGVDLILTEGFSRAGMPALEVLRGEIETELICSPPQLIAAVSDLQLEIPVPCFNFHDYREIATFVVELILD